MNTSAYLKQVSINEVMVRDGLQGESEFVPTNSKIELVNRLSHTGLSKIEVTSFVSPKVIPNLRDAKEVMTGITRMPGVSYVALVPNARGAERALECHVDEINLVMSIGETHNQANMRMSCQQSLEEFAQVMQLLQGSGIHINGTVATTFGCPFEGVQPLERILWAVESYLKLGMDSITLADTVGMASPKQVSEVSSKCLEMFPVTPFTLHFHNTRGMGLANAMAGVQAGISSFDASLGGIGGCPYAPGATGNICTEDLVHMFALCGIATGVDLDKLLPIAQDLPQILGHAVPSYLLKAGKSKTMMA